MPSSGAVAYGVIVSGIVAALALLLILRERRPAVVATAAAAAIVAPLCWDSILRHTGGDFFVDAPGVVFPISFEDTVSGVFATALATLLLGFGPLRTDAGRQLALTATMCGRPAALLVDIYLY